jgi:hypothetical protein
MVVANSVAESRCNVGRSRRWIFLLLEAETQPARRSGSPSAAARSRVGAKETDGRYYGSDAGDSAQSSGRLFAFVWFSNDRRLLILIIFPIVLLLVLVVIIIRVSRRHLADEV